MNKADTLFSARPAVVGMVHLPPLPGSPGWDRNGDTMETVIEKALTDAESIEKGGAAGIMIENFFDTPFTGDRVEAHTTAALAVCVHEIKKAVSIPVGVNVLRNDGLTAVSIAAVTGADFLRVNVLTHAMVTDQGIIQGRAYEISRLRSFLKTEARIFADVMVKHAYPLGKMDIATAAKDIAHRGGADVLVVSGSGTGSPINIDELRTVREAVPGFPLASGSGITPDNLELFGPLLDIMIVGTWIKENGDVQKPVDPDRVRRLVVLAAGLGK
jgi:uncharacterized protein